MIELLYEALRQPYGIIVSTDDVERLRAKLYPLRRGDPALMALSFIVSPTNPSSELWIVKKDAADAEEHGTPDEAHP